VKWKDINRVKKFRAGQWTRDGQEEGKNMPQTSAQDAKMAGNVTF